MDSRQRREMLRRLSDILNVKPESVPQALAKIKRETEQMEARLKSD